MIRTVKLDELKKYERRFIEQAINQDLSDNAYECDDYENEIIEGNKKVSFQYKSVTIYDEDGDPLDSEDELIINNIDEYDVEQLLKDNNIEYEKSTISIYLKNGNYRISDHKRPNYEANGVYHEHKYDEDIVLENEIDIYEYIENEIKRGNIK